MPEIFEPLNNFFGTVIQGVKGLVARFVSLVKGIFYRNQKTWFSSQQENRLRCIKLLDYYKGYQEVYARNNLATMAPTDFQNMNPFLETQNLVAYVTDKTADTFRDGVSIEAENEDDAEIYNEIVEKNSFDSLLQGIEGRLFLLEQLYIKAYWSEEDKIVKFESLLPHCVDVIPNVEDSHKIGTIVYPSSYSDSYSVLQPMGPYHAWTKDSYQLVDETGNPVNEKDLAETDSKNPYGLIPVVVLRKKFPIDPDFFYWPGNELEDAQDILNWMLTSKNYTMAYQSFGVAQVFGEVVGSMQVKGSNTRNVVPVLAISPGKVLQFARAPKDEKVGLEFAKPTADLTALQDDIRSHIDRVSRRYGISSPNSMGSKQIKAADTITLEQSDLEQYRIRIRQIFLAAIKELFDIATVVYNTHAKSNNLPELSGEGVTVKFMEAKVADKPVADQIAEDEWDLEHNLTNLVELYVEKNDDVDEAAAMDAIVANAKVSKELADKIKALSPAPTIVPGVMPASGSMPNTGPIIV
jgi:hypothetical protein